jgi:hypothetical protein
VLFCIWIYILLKRPRNLGNTVLLVTAIALFSISTTQSVINIVLGANDIDGVDVPYDVLSLADMTLYVINEYVRFVFLQRSYSHVVPPVSSPTD